MSCRGGETFTVLNGPRNAPHCPTEVESGKLSRLLGFEVQIRARPTGDRRSPYAVLVWYLQNGALPVVSGFSRPPGEEALPLALLLAEVSNCGGRQRFLFVRTANRT